MRLSTVLLLSAGVAAATPVTFELLPGAEECFYTLTSDTDCEVTYYFSVEDAPRGEDRVGYAVYGPRNAHSPIIERSAERSGEWAFTADDKGEYRFCFKGAAGDRGAKTVAVELKYDCQRNDDARSRNRADRRKLRNLREAKDDDDEMQRSLDDSVDRIERQLHVLERDMEYYITRNGRNHLTVRSTESRIGWFSLYGILVIVGMSAGQILLLQWLFTQSRKHKV